ncbi:MAG: multidrug effflux MFS transporter [Alphaproteobacteria bacterium]
MAKLRAGTLPLIIVLSAVLVVGEMATDMFIAALPQLSREFSASVSTVQLTLGTYMVGFALSQLAYGPISDRFGRRVPLMLGTALFLGASLLSAQATSINMLIALRFLQSLGGAAGVTICMAIIRDMHDRDRSAIMLARLGSIIAIAPAIAPLFGGWLIETFSWRATFYALAVWAAIAIWLVWFFIPESNLNRDPRATQVMGMFRNFGTLLRNRTYVGFMLTLVCCFGTFFAFIFGAPFVFIEVFGMRESTFPLIITVQVVGFVAGTTLSERLAPRYGLDTVFRWAIVTAWVSGMVTAAFPLFGIETIVTIVAPMIVFAFAVGFIFPLGTASALGPFPMIAGTAAALLGFIQTLGGAGFGVVSGAFYDGRAIGMTSVMGVAVTLAVLVYFTLLWRRPVEAASPDDTTPDAEA